MTVLVNESDYFSCLFSSNTNMNSFDSVGQYEINNNYNVNV